MDAWVERLDLIFLLKDQENEISDLVIPFGTISFQIPIKRLKMHIHIALRRC